MELIERVGGSQLLKNILSLSVLQAANYLLPLLTIPYLVRTIGVENFGVLAFATAVNAYFILIADFGFNFSATRKVASMGSDRRKVSQLYSAVVVVKAGLLVSCALMLFVLLFLTDAFGGYAAIFWLSFGVVVGNALMPIWLFQGLECMGYISILNIAAKIFFTICIFMFVDGASDTILVPLFTSLGYIAAAIFSLWLVSRELEIRFHRPSVGEIKSEILDGFHVFLSTLSISFYTTSATVLLGVFSNNAVVGQFSMADKIVQAVKGAYMPISQAFFPLIARRIKLDPVGGMRFAAKIGGGVSACFMIFSGLVFVLAEEIVFLIYGDHFSEVVRLLRIMAFLPVIIVLSNFAGVQIMLNLGLKKIFTAILSFAAFLGVVLSLWLVPEYYAFASAFIMVVVEIFVTLAMVVCLFLKWSYVARDEDYK